MTTTRRQLLNASAECGTGEVLTPTSINVIDPNVRCGFPDLVAEAHTGETVRFYEDRIQNKVFMVNFFSIDDDATHKQIEKIARIVELLGDKVGSVVHVTSLSVDPVKDTVERLAEHAEAHGVRDGWLLLRAKGEDVAVLAQGMYHFNRGASAGMGRLVFYGNGMGTSRIWGTFPAAVRPEDAAHRVSWVMPQKKPAALRRAGPARPGQSAYPWNHRAYA